MARWFLFRNPDEAHNQCRICLRTNGVLVNPCHCDGPQALVHSECIYHQLVSANRIGCDSCGTIIRFKMQQKICQKWKLVLFLFVTVWLLLYFGTILPIWIRTETWAMLIPRWGIHIVIFIILYPLIVLNVMKKIKRTEWIYEAQPGFPNILVL